MSQAEVTSRGRVGRGGPRFRTEQLSAVLWWVLVYGLLLLGAFVMFVPLAWMISTSLKQTRQIFVFPPIWIPDPVEWGNYPKALTAFPFVLYIRNTLIIAGIALVSATLSSSMAAYAFARLDWPGRDLLFVFVLSTLMIPGVVTLVPQFILWNRLGFVDTIVPLVAQAVLGGSPIYVFLLRQFFRTIPREMDEAALLDGCSKIGILWRVVLPLSKEALGIVAIFSFLFHWNDFMGPLIYLNSAEKRTLALGLSAFRASEGGVQPAWNLLMAVSLVAMVPPITVFFLAQRHFIQGITITGVKG